MPMFDKLLALLSQSPPPTSDTVGAPFQRRELAVVALLIELAQSDRTVPAEEGATIERIVRERFALDAAAAGRLISAARRVLDASLEDWVFAAAVRDGFDVRERVEIVELLWEVVYADRHLARLEASLMRRLADALEISQSDREAARAQAFARMGHARGAESDVADAE
jgi:uncharacterized tellurite resistance protein B-like protein